MPIYQGSSTRRYCIASASTGMLYPMIVKAGGGRVYQPGNGRIFSIGYPRTNLAYGKIPSWGYSNAIQKYQSGPGTQYPFLSGTSYKYPTGWLGMNTDIVGTNALTTSQVATHSGNFTIGGKSYPLYGFKVTRTGTLYLKVYVMLTQFSGYSSLTNKGVYFGYISFDSSRETHSTKTLTHRTSGLYTWEGTLTVDSGRTMYITLPIINDSTTYLSGQYYGVQSYYAFSTAE